MRISLFKNCEVKVENRDGNKTYIIKNEKKNSYTGACLYITYDQYPKCFYNKEIYTMENAATATKEKNVKLLWDIWSVWTPIKLLDLWHAGAWKSNKTRKEEKGPPREISTKDKIYYEEINFKRIIYKTVIFCK